MRRARITVIAIALGLLWWFYGYNWAIKPHTYRIGGIFLAVVLAAGAFHVEALWKFHKMVKVVQAAEDAGMIGKGSTLFAVNQRFRYTVRVLEGLWVFGIGVLAIISVHYPKLETNPNYGRFVLSYFIGSIALTGYLTYRDLHVLRVVRAMDVGAVLEPVP